jgi:hypothetical protein
MLLWSSANPAFSAVREHSVALEENIDGERRRRPSDIEGNPR